MNRCGTVVIISLLALPAYAQPSSSSFDTEAECKAISTEGLSDCACRGRYFASKFGPDDGAAALHMVSRAYAPEPKVALTDLYGRFGAAKLNKLAENILETRGEVAFFCPFGTDLSE